MPSRHRTVLQTVMGCRRGGAGHHVYQCEGCGHRHVVPSGCGDRHCPNCQYGKGQAWLQRQLAARLPCNYFLITLTVPQELRGFLRRHQRVGYDALMDASAGALKKLARDQRFVGADQIGFFSVLHTWGRTLQYHPHVHMVVPGGGLSRDRTRWCSSRVDLFVHVRPLSVIYRAKFRDAMVRADLFGEIDSEVWKKPWTVNSQAVGDATGTLKYLAGYVFRVGISNNRILSAQDGRVTFRYQDSETGRMRRMTLEAGEFLRRLLQHILPRGFTKVRHYGFLSPNARVNLEHIRQMILLVYDVVTRLVAPTHQEPKPQPIPCPKCGKPLAWAGFVPPLISTG
jgi:hypothetical protein